MTILDQLAEHARKRTETAKRLIPAAEIRNRAEALARAERRGAAAVPGGSPHPSLPPSGTGLPFRFEEALRKPGLSFICECKKASPSKGLIAPDFPYREIALDYEAAGADAISVLTEPKWFLGEDRYLQEILAAVRIPCLRKDFTVDAYNLYEAKLLGASAVLLICAILEPHQIAEYIPVCDSLGLSALVEAHSEAEVETALSAGARIIGVNNRNLKDFSVDTENSRRLRVMIPGNVLFVSESGVRSAEDTAALRDIGADAVLIGETLMRAADRKAKLAELKEAPQPCPEKH